ncbi:prephenate dehydrogenase [Methylotetracoccus oryzae]|uniref:prephenate dehydrogenase n=1 Tax=Methylotetracoccus oryzae TaxID=1919059 RepID=UPI00111956BD|nr:prephenate dehydrogenase/arogenate dehydrogenase family protein [Methylotetracoccus oryzae]
MIDRLCVIGVGLIGGSVARAARERGLCREIVGVDRDARNLAEATTLGVIDRGSAAVSAAEDADFVVIAVPVGAVGRVCGELAPFWSDTAVYTDVGSTKLSVIDACRAALGTLPPNFVPAHPIAGAERSGVGAANAELYAGKRVILTPDPATSTLACERVTAFWTALGARVSAMDPAHHDEVLAATSHLPHVLAFTLVHLLGRKDEQAEIFQYAAGGFRDFTRIAASDPEMWLDICLANATQILTLLQAFGAELNDFADCLEQRDATRLFEFLSTAREARQRSLERMDN